MNIFSINKEENVGVKEKEKKKELKKGRGRRRMYSKTSALPIVLRLFAGFKKKFFF